MPSSDRSSEAVELLYQSIRRSAGSEGHAGQVDPAVVASLAMELTVGGVVREQTDCTDLASTGGPGSISTTLVPLMTSAAGIPVAKVGVPGRPAGAVDTLANIPGYRWSSTESEFDLALRQSGFAHTAANQHWAPGDAILFRRRQADGTQQVPALVVASLLSKKLAAGVRYPGFEVRAARHGNFGATRGEVRRNAELLLEVARHLGMRATVFVTEAEYPHQPWIGRGEALLAIAAVCARSATTDETDGVPASPRADDWVAHHYQACERMAQTLVGLSAQVDEAPASAENGHSGRAVDSVDMPRDTADALAAHLVAHGSTRERFDQRVTAAAAEQRISVYADASGYVDYDLKEIRDHLVRANTPGAPMSGHEESTFPDRAGVLLHVPPGVRVASGDEVLSLRWSSPQAKPQSRDLFTIADRPSELRSAADQLQEIIN